MLYKYSLHDARSFRWKGIKGFAFCSEKDFSNASVVL